MWLGRGSNILICPSFPRRNWCSWALGKVLFSFLPLFYFPPLYPYLKSIRVRPTSERRGSIWLEHSTKLTKILSNSLQTLLSVFQRKKNWKTVHKRASLPKLTRLITRRKKYETVLDFTKLGRIETSECSSEKSVSIPVDHCLRSWVCHPSPLPPSHATFYPGRYWPVKYTFCVQATRKQRVRPARTVPTFMSLYRVHIYLYRLTDVCMCVEGAGGFKPEKSFSLPILVTSINHAFSSLSISRCRGEFPTEVYKQNCTSLRLKWESAYFALNLR